MHFKINLDDSPKISFVAHTTATKKNKRKLNRFPVLELKRKREGESAEKEERVGAIPSRKLGYISYILMYSHC